MSTLVLVWPPAAWPGWWCFTPTTFLQVSTKLHQRWQKCCPCSNFNVDVVIYNPYFMVHRKTSKRTNTENSRSGMGWAEQEKSWEPEYVRPEGSQNWSASSHQQDQGRRGMKSSFLVVLSVRSLSWQATVWSTACCFVLFINGSFCISSVIMFSPL